MLSEIEKYLSGAGYYRWGIKLLRQINHDPFELRELEKHLSNQYAPTSAEKRIIEILKDYQVSDIKDQRGTEIQKQKPEKQETVFVTQSPTNQLTNQPTNQPTVINELQKEIQILMKLRADWHSQMHYAKKQEYRAKCAVEVLSLTDDIGKKYAMLEAYNDHNILPPAAAVKNTSGEINAAEELGELIQREKSVAPRVSKIRSLLKKTTDDSRRLQLQTELKEKENELSEIKQKMQYLKK